MSPAILAANASTQPITVSVALSIASSTAAAVVSVGAAASSTSIASSKSPPAKSANAWHVGASSAPTKAQVARIASGKLPSASAAERREAGDVGSLPKDSNTCHAVEITVKIVSITLSAPSDALKKPATDETPSPMWSMMSVRVPLSTTWPMKPIAPPMSSSAFSSTSSTPWTKCC